MILQARVIIRTALAYLVAATLLGAALLLNQAIGVSGALFALQPVFYHLLTIGWLTQLILGVAVWMFPAASREQPHGNPRLTWLAYLALNAGLLLRLVAEPLLTWRPAPWLGGALALSALLQVTGIWLFIGLVWPRVKPRPTPPRRRSETGEAD